MSDFRTIRGFEDVWRPPVNPHRKSPETRAVAPPDIRARLARLVARAPEVMVKITGRTRDPAHLTAHLTYVTRNGDLAAEGRDGFAIEGRREVLDLASDWAAAQMFESRRRANSPFSVAIILSMPAGTDPVRLRDAARAFAAEVFADRFDYMFVLHTDAGHPHVHLTVRALGDRGERLNPKKADLENWRQAFARALRDRGVEAEATPRRARGVTRKAERMPMRKLREQSELRGAPPGRIQRSAYQEAARTAFGGDVGVSAWEERIVQRQHRIRAFYLGQARLLQVSADPADRALGQAVESFVKSMPAPDTQRLALARELRGANSRLRDRNRTEPPSKGRDPSGRAR